MPDEEHNIELRSDEVKDILGKVPGWLTRNGIIVFLFVIAMLITGAWIYKVPDIKKARITLTSKEPPATIEARAYGKIEQLFVKDNAVVSAGDILAEIENSADLEDILELKKQLAGMILPMGQNPVFDLPSNGNAEFGSIQDTYSLFKKHYQDYIKFVQLDYHQRKIQVLNEEYEIHQKYNENLDNRASILKEEFELAEKQYLRDSSLFLQGVVSESGYEDSKSLMLSKRDRWQEILSLKSENEIKIAGIRDRILEMELRGQEALGEQLNRLEESLNKLKAAIAQWEQQYLIKAPVDGNVTFNRIWSEYQNVKIGDKVMTVVPGDAGQLIGKIELPLQGAGEVKVGQKVNIRFENFPYMEYGMVKGLVSNVSKVPQNQYYTVEVELPDGLVTYYGMTIEFSQNMEGEAEIITDNMRLLQRIFNPVRNAITRQKEM